MSSILINLLAAAIPLSSSWLLFGTGEEVTYEILSSSMMVDEDNRVVQFQLKSTFDTERTESGGKIKSKIEPVILLCNEDIFITAGYTSFDINQKQITQGFSANVSRNKGIKGTAVTELLNFGCKTFKAVPQKIVPLKITV